MVTYWGTETEGSPESEAEIVIIRYCRCAKMRIGGVFLSLSARGIFL